jgi:hypothetical protein
MVQIQEKNLIIVHNAETRRCAKFLSRFIDKKIDAEVPINAIALDSKAFAAYPVDNKSAKQKILYIGDYPGSETAGKNIIIWKFDKFGIRYGWHGNKALIKFDEKSLLESDFMNMVVHAKHILIGKTQDMITQDVGNPPFRLRLLKWLGGLPQQFKKMSPGEGIGYGIQLVFVACFTIAATAGYGLIGGRVVLDAMLNDKMFNDKKDKLDPVKIREQQMKFGVLHFCLFHLADFMGIKFRGIKDNEKVRDDVSDDNYAPGVSFGNGDTSQSIIIEDGNTSLSATIGFGDNGVTSQIAIFEDGNTSLSASIEGGDTSQIAIIEDGNTSLSASIGDGDHIPVVGECYGKKSRY